MVLDRRAELSLWWILLLLTSFAKQTERDVLLRASFAPLARVLGRGAQGAFGLGSAREGFLRVVWSAGLDEASKVDKSVYSPVSQPSIYHRVLSTWHVIHVPASMTWNPSLNWERRAASASVARTLVFGVVDHCHCWSLVCPWSWCLRV